MAGGKKRKFKNKNHKKDYYVLYYNTTYKKNKLKRILKYNGLDAANAWARKYDGEKQLRSILG